MLFSFTPNPSPMSTRERGVSAPTRRPGLTVLDVLVGLFLLLALLGIAIPFLVEQHRNAARVECSYHLKRLGEAIHGFHENPAVKDRRFLPPSRVADGYATWPLLIVPYLHKDHALAGWDVSRPFAEQEAAVRAAWLPEMFCPARSRPSKLSGTDAGAALDGAVGDYGCVSGDGSADRPWTTDKANGPMILGAVFEKKDGRIVRWESRTSLDSLVRGVSNTLLLGEKQVPAGGWGDPKQGDGPIYDGTDPANCARVGGPGFPLASSGGQPFNSNFGGNHPRVCLFIAADVSLRPITFDVSLDVLGRMMRRED